METFHRFARPSSAIFAFSFALRTFSLPAGQVSVQLLRQKMKELNSLAS